MVGNQVVIVAPGQTLTGRDKIAKAIKLNRSKVERFLKLLEIEHQIEQRTFTKYRIITILNWHKYQQSEHQNEQQVSNKRAASEHKQECKNDKNKTLCSSGDELGEKYYITKKGKKLSGKRLESFDRFWDAFGYKLGRAPAADAWMSIPVLTDAIVDKICAAARVECSRRPEILKQGKTPKMAQGWLSERRWEDEGLFGNESPAYGTGVK